MVRGMENGRKQIGCIFGRKTKGKYQRSVGEMTISIVGMTAGKLAFQ